MLLFGHHVVKAALCARKRRLECLWVALPDNSWQTLADKAKVPLKLVNARQLNSLCGCSNHQGVALRCGPLPIQAAELLLNQKLVTSKPDSSTGIKVPAVKVLVVLDQVIDPHNLGAIARSAEVFGSLGLILPRRDSAPLSLAAIRASAGALEWLPLGEATNLARFLGQAHQRGWWSVAAVAQGGKSPSTIHPIPATNGQFHWILVFGSEGKGIRALVQKHCDYLCTIPTHGSGCLNVSNAAAILLQHFCY